MRSGREGKRAAPFEFSRSGGARGGGFRWVATLGGGAFGIYMQAGRQGERDDIFLRFRCSFFPGRGAVFYGRSLQSVAALLVYARQRVGRVSGLNIFFALLPFYFPGPEGGVFRQISTIGGGAFSMLCMPAGKEG